MDEFEKVEKLRQRADVSYEEAKKALEEANGDLLDAMILLEAQGKAVKGEQTTRSTTYDDQKDYVSVVDTVDKSSRKNDKPLGQKLKHLFHLIWIKIRDNKFVVERNDNNIIDVPVWVLIVAIMLAFWPVCVILIVGLFFNCRYAILGADDASKINNVLDKAGDAVDKVKDEFDKL
ncbi:MAG: UBA/TS-N domain protein [Lachnospiraceae bacterium]|nr:UBA/TS-N domain protein [Lachnospiraceae bacterium]